MTEVAAELTPWLQCMSTGWLAQSSTTSSARWITYAVAGGTESTVEAVSDSLGLSRDISG